MTISVYARAAALAAAIVCAAGVGNASAFATTQQLDCVLGNTGAAGTEPGPVSIVFDVDKKTLTADNSGRAYTFDKVLITNVSVNGQAEDVSIGIDRSSLGIVWQRYNQGSVSTEYGRCHAVRTRS